MWRQWANAILGLLVVIFALMGGEHLYRYLAVGILIVILAVWSALGNKKMAAPMGQ